MQMRCMPRTSLTNVYPNSLLLPLYYSTYCDSVVDPDPHHFGNLDPHPEPDPHQFADDKLKFMEYEPILALLQGLSL
jgi:hypothetical protein